jgi:hypothetical protein
LSLIGRFGVLKFSIALAAMNRYAFAPQFDVLVRVRVHRKWKVILAALVEKPFAFQIA